jgi:hypothetical protein
LPSEPEPLPNNPFSDLNKRAPKNPE